MAGPLILVGSRFIPPNELRLRLKMGRTGDSLAASPAILCLFRPVPPSLIEHDEGTVRTEMRGPLRQVTVGLFRRSVVRRDGIFVTVAVVRDDQFELLFVSHIRALLSL